MTGSLEALGNGFPVAFNATPPNRAVGCVLRRLEYIPCCETTYEPAAQLAEPVLREVSNVCRAWS